MQVDAGYLKDGLRECDMGGRQRFEAQGSLDVIVLREGWGWT